MLEARCIRVEPELSDYNNVDCVLDPTRYLDVLHICIVQYTEEILRINLKKKKDANMRRYLKSASTFSATKLTAEFLDKEQALTSRELGVLVQQVVTSAHQWEIAN